MVALLVNVSQSQPMSDAFAHRPNRMCQGRAMVAKAKLEPWLLQGQFVRRLARLVLKPQSCPGISDLSSKHEMLCREANWNFLRQWDLFRICSHRISLNSLRPIPHAPNALSSSFNCAQTISAILCFKHDWDVSLCVTGQAHLYSWYPVSGKLHLLRGEMQVTDRRQSRSRWLTTTKYHKAN